MAGDATRRLGRRLAVSPNGVPTHGNIGHTLTRQAVVSAVRADSVDVLFAGDAPDDPATVGWTSYLPPSVGDVGWVHLVGTTGIWAGAQNVQPDTGSSTGTLVRYLGQDTSTTVFFQTGGDPVTTMLSLEVSIPAGATGLDIRLEGRTHHAITAAGVGLVLNVTNAPGGIPASTDGLFSGSLTVIRHDTVVEPGLNTYDLVLNSTVAGQQVRARGASLEAWIVA